MKSKTKISKQLQKKTDSVLVETIILAKKHPDWLKVADLLSRPRRKKTIVNLDEISELTKNAKEGEAILILGKVLSRGELNKRVKIVALGFSEEAKRKLLNSKCDLSLIVEEIKKNPKMVGLKLINSREGK